MAPETGQASMGGRFLSATVVVTIATRDRLHGALALFRLLRQHHSEIRTVLVVADLLPKDVDGLPTDVETLAGERVGPKAWKRFCFQYDPMALCCALKPFALLFALTTTGASRALYFDSDVGVYGPLCDLLAKLDTCSVLLTPHHATPLNADGSSVIEDESHRTGIYNMGFAGVRCTPEALACLEWWKGKMANRCVKKLEENLWYDQGFMSASPALFGEVTVERAPQYNVAPWNLNARGLERQGTIYTVGGNPLVFFHFSGFRLQEPELIFGRPVSRFPPCFRNLLGEYADLLRQCGAERYTQRSCAFSCMSDGTPVKPLWREAIRIGLDTFADVEDPFDANLKERYVAAEQEVRMQVATQTEREMLLLQASYRRLADSFPVRQLLWLRRRLVHTDRETLGGRS